MALVVLGIIAMQSRPVHAQWTTGTNINNTNSGSVSVGTTNPGGDKLIVAGNTVSGNIAGHTQLYSSYNSQNNVIMELGYDTATSSDIPLASLVLSKNLTGANNALGVIQFANRSIANGNEKRISAIASFTDGATNSGLLSFNTTAAGTLAERMRITSAGNVGIGTSTPTRKFEILATDGEAMRLYRNSNNVGWGVNLVFAFNNSSGAKVDYAGVHGH